MPKFFRAVDKIKPVFDITDKVIMFLCKLLLIADILIATLTVIQRYVPNSIFPPMPWGEQMVLTFMVYMAVLSATLAIRSLKGAATYHSRPPLCIARTNILDRTEDHDGYVTTLQRILYPLPTEDETFFRGGKDYFLVDERL